MTSTMPDLVYIVEDDDELANLLIEYLSGHGLSVRHAAHGLALNKLMVSQTPQLMLLDMMLPGEDGLSITRRLHQQVPIIMMSARAEDVDRIVGLELGAEDFIIKPFNPRELLARIRVVLRRHTAVKPLSPQVKFGDFVLDSQRRTLSYRHTLIPLTSAEFSLLRVLVSHPYRVLTRDDLLDLAKSLSEHLPFDRSIDARIARLRKKIEPIPSSHHYIQTVRGQGYLFDPLGRAES